MAKVEFKFIILEGVRVRHYVFENKTDGLKKYHLYVNFQENIFKIDFCSNIENWRVELDMWYKPKQWLSSLGWSLNLLDSYDAIEDFFDSVAFAIEYNKRNFFGLKLNIKFVERYELENYI